MTVVVIAKSPWNVSTYRNVTNISIVTDAYSITNSDGTYTFPVADYIIRIM